MRTVIIFSSMLAFLGAALILGSLIMIPKTTTELVRVDLSKTWVDDAFVLPAFENRTYAVDSIIVNSSIFQINVESSDFMSFKIVSEIRGLLWLESQSRRDRTYFWTPPSEGFGAWCFVFSNPSSATINVEARITEFYTRTFQYKRITTYHPLLQPAEAYAGLVAIAASIALNIIYLLRETAKQIAESPVTSEWAD